MGDCLPGTREATSHLPLKRTAWFGWELGHLLKLEELAPSSTTEALVAPQFGTVAGQWHFKNVFVAFVVFCYCVAQGEHADSKAWTQKENE